MKLHYSISPRIKYLVLYINNNPIKFEWVTEKSLDEIIKQSKEKTADYSIKILRITLDNILYDPIMETKRYRMFNIKKF